MKPTECRDCGHELNHDGRVWRDNSGFSGCAYSEDGDHDPRLGDRSLAEIFPNSVPGNFWGAER